MRSFIRSISPVLLLTLTGALLLSCAESLDDDIKSDQGQGGSGEGGAGQGGAGGDPMGTGGAGGGTGGSGGAGGSAESALATSLSSMSFTMDCMPGGTPGITGNFQAYYDNTAGVSSAIGIIKSAKLTMTLAADSYVWSFPVTPSSTFVPAGQSTNGTHMVGVGTGAGMGMLCDYCGQIWKLDVEWDVGGKTTAGSLGPTPVNCVQ